MTNRSVIQATDMLSESFGNLTEYLVHHKSCELSGAGDVCTCYLTNRLTETKQDIQELKSAIGSR